MGDAMPGNLPILRIVTVILFLDAALAAWASIAGSGASVVLPHLLPGQFGPGLAFSGNQLFYAVIVYLSAVIILGLGLFILMRAAGNTILIGPDRFNGLLSRVAGLSREDIAATHYAVSEEQKEELDILHHGRLTVWLGGALLLLGFAEIIFTFAAANPAGAPLLQQGAGAIANHAVTAQQVDCSWPARWPMPSFWKFRSSFTGRSPPWRRRKAG